MIKLVNTCFLVLFFLPINSLLAERRAITSTLKINKSLSGFSDIQQYGCLVDFDNDGRLDTLTLPSQTCKDLGGAGINLFYSNGSISPLEPSETNYSILTNSTRLEKRGLATSNTLDYSRANTTSDHNKGVLAFDVPGLVPLPMKLNTKGLSNADLDKFREQAQREPALLKPYQDEHICWNFADEAERINSDDTYFTFECCEETFYTYHPVRVIHANREEGGARIIPADDDRQKPVSFWRMTKAYAHSINDRHYADPPESGLTYEPQFIAALLNNKLKNPIKDLEVNRDLNKNQLIDPVEVGATEKNRRTICLQASYESFQDHYNYAASQGINMDNLYVKSAGKPFSPPAMSCKNFFLTKDSKGRFEHRHLSPEVTSSLEKGLVEIK